MAVNIDPRESDFEPISDAVLEKWQDAASLRDESFAAQEAAVEMRSLELWPWALLFMALVLVAESVLGNAHLLTRAKAH